MSVIVLFFFSPFICIHKHKRCCHVLNMHELLPESLSSALLSLQVLILYSGWSRTWTSKTKVGPSNRLWSVIQRSSASSQQTSIISLCNILSHSITHCNFTLKKLPACCIIKGLFNFCYTYLFALACVTFLVHSFFFFIPLAKGQRTQLCITLN